MEQDILTGEATDNAHGCSVEICTDQAEIQKWIDFAFMNDNIVACIRSYCGQYKMSELQMYKMICVALIREKLNKANNVESNQ